MVGAGQQLACGPHDGRSEVGCGGRGAAGVPGPLQHVHQVGDEEVALQRRHTLLREDGGLPAHGAGQGQAVHGDVVLQAPGRQEGGEWEGEGEGGRKNRGRVGGDKGRHG